MTIPAPQPDSAAVVTGASAGIGAELARGLARRGHNLVLVARRRDRLEALATELEVAHGIRAEVYPCDLANRDARNALREDLGARNVAVLCNNAGFATFGDLRNADPVREREQVELNVNAVHDLTLAVLPGMLRRGAGAILITGSTAGHQPFPGNATYAASKAFANSFAESLHAELRNTAVTATLLAPGPVATEFNQSAGIGHRDGLISRVAVSAADTADQALHGLERGDRTVVPGLVAKLQTLGGAYTPRGVLLPALHLVSKGLA